MTKNLFAATWALKLPLALGLALGLSACGDGGTLSTKSFLNFASARPESEGIDPERKAFAIAMAKELRARGQRVWCVPFARNASGIEIRGNARTWWSQAEGVYDRGHAPKPGAVMAFTGTRKLPLGHVAVVSEVISEREIRIDHANWKRNQLSFGMTVVDVSDKNDWSAVRVMSNPGQLGRVYPVSGFIYEGATRG
ncbi:CHAP domain-containing protein [Rhodobacter sp. TJ_12]|uniref:CHAP domain-containing protein n=1 Tax=Rhodobacter sp. TJ_12 TaxID=2029399 RepID=UPI001CBE4826|nr:CHAP domain-containing protein [Rhodobacter sp. TJ_12]MBZ4021023.1 CHAP domain-containing protein [Rhodobacter sp. TJ_12]